jgi:hypothetical protein
MFFKELLHIVLFIVFLLTYIMAYNYVKPFLINRKRKYSTLSLKLTYLIYLAFLLIFMFLFLLFGANQVEYRITDSVFFGVLLLLFLPNIGILIRRKVKSIRVIYNYIFTVINLSATYYLIAKLIENKWFV